MEIWTIKLGESNYLSGECYESGIIGIRWELTETDIKMIKTKRTKKEANKYLWSLFSNSYSIGNIRRFIWEAKIDDYVFCGSAWESSDPDDESLGYLLGKITSEARKPDENELKNRFTVVRSVEWKFFDGETFSRILADGIKRQQLTIARFNKISYKNADKLFKEEKLEDIETIMEEAYDQMLDSVIKSFQNLLPREFEQYIKDLLESEGWTDLELTSESGDEGIDIIGNCSIATDVFIPVIVQVKRYSCAISPAQIKEFQEVENSNKELMRFFITSNEFSKNAPLQALEEPRVFLLSGTDLARIALRNNLIPYISWTPV